MITVKDGTNQANNGLGTQDTNDETWWIPPAAGSVIESTFPDPGVYVGVDHAMADVVKGGAFAVVAMENSTATDYPTGTCVAPAGSESVVCEEGAAAEAAATSEQASSASEGANDNANNNNGNGNEEDGQTEVTQNATMLNTSASSGNATGNGTMMAGNSTGGNQTGASGTEIIISPGSSSPSNTKFYEPPTSTVKAGTTVTWKNADSTLHTVTSGSAEGGEPGADFDSSYMAGGKTFQWTFSTPGTFDYFCTLHPYMKGQVVVN
jgi:plastocyanin